MKRLGALVLVLALVGVSVGAVVALNAHRAASQAAERAVALQRQMSALQQPRPQQSATPQESTNQAYGLPDRSTIRQTCEEASSLADDLRPLTDLSTAAAPVAGLVQPLGQTGGRAAAMVTVGQAGAELSTGLREACAALDPLVAGGTDGTGAHAALATLSARRGQLRESVAHLQRASASLEGVDLAALDERTRSLVLPMRQRLPQATAQLSLLADVPSLVGFDGPRRYLILGQNNDELRPTGGFIGTVGILALDQGEVTAQEYGSSFRFNLPADRQVPPPAPLRRYMDAAYWQLQESNWAPDFPTAARQALYFYGQLHPEPVDGVVALDQDMIALLLRATGPVQVTEYGEAVTADNARERIDHYVHEVGGETETQRKAFVSALFTHLMERLRALPPERAGALATALADGLRDQHLQFWTADQQIQTTLADLGWDGRMLAAPADYLYVVSANVGANKVNRDVEQSLQYDVLPSDDGRLVSHLRLVLRNHHDADPGPYRTAEYRDYLRVYVPPASELIDASGLDDGPATDLECGRTVFGGLVVVAPGGERTVDLRYRLPASVRPDHYSLLVQRQPGAPSVPFSVSGDANVVRSLQTTLSASSLAVPGSAQTTAEPPPAPDPGAQACGVHDQAPTPLAAPARLDIPRIGVNADVAELGVQEDGTLEAPATGEVVGWYESSARPGQAGNMVVSGHVDWEKRSAIFASLATLGPGDTIDVVAADGKRYAYTVEWVRDVDAVHAPLADILGPTTGRWLTAITCGGRFNQATHQYESRTVVRAVLRGPS
jgi:sortase (surface protein transpeptidase)